MKKVIDLQRENNDVQQIANDLKSQLEETVQQHTVVQELTDYIETLQKEKKQAAESFESKLKILEKKVAENHQQNIDVAEQHQEHVKELMASVEHLQAEKQKLAEELQKTFEEQGRIQENNLALEQLRNENKKLTEELQKLTEDVANGSEVRRMKGFYTQLRSQFEEKSKVLDETRRELFATQEKVAAAERAQELTQLSLNKAHEEHCKRLLSEAAEEIELVEREHQEEICQLQSLVDSLMTNSQRDMAQL